jgi:hypothetical protein
MTTKYQLFTNLQYLPETPGYMELLNIPAKDRQKLIRKRWEEQGGVEKIQIDPLLLHKIQTKPKIPRFNSGNRKPRVPKPKVAISQVTSPLEPSRKEEIPKPMKIEHAEERKHDSPRASPIEEPFSNLSVSEPPPPRRIVKESAFKVYPWKPEVRIYAPSS